jgi:hypothetical protein
VASLLELPYTTEKDSMISSEITIGHRNSAASFPELLYSTYTDSVASLPQLLYATDTDSVASLPQLLYATDTDSVASLPELPCNTDRRRLPWRLSRAYHMAQTHCDISPRIIMSHASNFRY